MSGVSLALMFTAAPMQAGSPATALVPKGPWRIDATPADSACTMTRDFGTGPAATTLIFRRHALDNRLHVEIARTGSSEPAPMTPGQIELLPSGTLVTGTARTAYAENSFRAASLTIDGNAQERLRTSIAVIVTGTDGAAIRVASAGASRALTSLDRCIATVQRRLGVDPKNQAAIAIQATPKDNEAEWVRVADYPLEAIRNRLAGTVKIIWTVETDGSVTNCRIRVSSGADLLDNAACGAIMHRASYHPALSKDGRPIASQRMRSVTWMLPQAPW